MQDQVQHQEQPLTLSTIAWMLAGLAFIVVIAYYMGVAS